MLHLRLIRLFAALAMTATVGMTAPHAARATVVTEDVFDNNDFLLGSIAFPAFTGSGTAGVQLSLLGFTPADITALSFTIDPNTLDVLDLYVEGTRGDNPCPDDMNACSYATLLLTETEVQASLLLCAGGPNGLCLIEDEFSPVTFVPRVGEPSPLAFGVLGLLGLALVRRGRHAG